VNTNNKEVVTGAGFSETKMGIQSMLFIPYLFSMISTSGDRRTGKTSRSPAGSSAGQAMR
jgi:hypothetical protein